MAVVSQEQLIRYDAVASQVTVCLSLTHDAIHHAMKETNCPDSKMKTLAMHHDALMMRCLRVSKKIFGELRARASQGDPSSANSELSERVQKYQEKLRYLSDQLFESHSSVFHDKIQRNISFSSSNVSSFAVRVGKMLFNAPLHAQNLDPSTEFHLLTGKLKALLSKFKENEDKRIAALETAKKEVIYYPTRVAFGLLRVEIGCDCPFQVTHIIQKYEDMMLLHSDRVEEPA